MLGFLKHIFIPHGKNNHRAKILHHSSLFIVILLLFVSTFFFNVVKKTHPDILGVSYSISENELLAQVNAQRQANGLSVLLMNSELSDAARRKAADMFSKNYWAHFSPDGSSSPWGFIRASGYNYQFAGENLAKGFTDTGSLMNAWMNSPTHRENILSGRFKEVGFAIASGTLQGEETVLVVEMFGASTNPALATAETPEVRAAQTTEPIQQPSPTMTPNISQESLTEPNVKIAASMERAPKIDAAVTSKTVTAMGLSFLFFGFLMDALIIGRKKVPRVVGHNLDHILLILTFILFMIMMKGGIII